MDYSSVKSRLKLLLLACLMSFNIGVYSQGNGVKVSINRTKITIKEALQEVEKQSKMSLAYNESKLNGNKQISLNLTDKSLSETMDAILQDTGFSYELKGEQIMIVSEKNSAKEKKTIKGQIVDELGEPLPGATISIKGGTVGTIADYDGNYSLSASTGDVLVYSFLGYTSKEMIVANANVIDVKMVSDSKELDAVVVTALGIKRSEKALSYNVQQFKDDDLLKNKDANFLNALSGKVAGVNINASAAGVGGATKVVMRGPKSITQSNNALYVVDGIPLPRSSASGGTEFDSKGSSEGIADLNPEDIESVSVLTGAAAAALYGSDGAQGAIVITTKKGHVGKTTVTVSQTTEFLNPFVMPKFQNKYGTGSIYSPDASTTDRSWGPLLNSANYMGYSPKDDYLRTGVVATESVSVSTGSERNQTYVSAGAVNSNGMIPNSGYDRLNFTVRNTTKFLNDKMTLDMGASYIKQKDQNLTTQGRYGNPLLPAYLVPRGADWNEVKMYERYDSQDELYKQYWPGWTAEFNGQNPYWINYRNMRQNKKDRYMINAGLNYEVLDWLSVGGRARIDHSANDFTEKLNASSNKTLTEGGDNGFYGVNNNREKNLYADMMVNVNKRFNEDFTVQATLGTSIEDKRFSMVEIRGKIRDNGVPNHFNITNLDNEFTKMKEQPYREQTQSIFASGELGYKGAYYLTLTARNDWASQLAGPASNTPSFFYPSVGTSVVLSEVLPMPKQIQYLKARASFASVGIPIDRWLANPYYQWNEAGKEYAAMRNYPVSDLKAQRTDSWELGITAKFLKNFNLDLSLYQTNTRNQLYNPGISVSSGYNEIYVQTGNIRNRGIELSFGYDNKWGDFGWSSTYTFSANENKIIELADNVKHPETGERFTIEKMNLRGLSQAHFILTKGGSLGDLYSRADLVRDSNGNIYVDENGQVTLNNDPSQEHKLGSVLPKANMSWSNQFSWKQFDLSFLISARLGGIAYSATQATMDLYGVSEASANARDNGGVWLNNGTNLVNAEKWYTIIGGREGLPQYYTYSATNVRLQELSVGYTFKKEQLWGIAETTVSFVGRNLWMIYNKAPFDPEAVASTGNYYQGVDYFMTPSARSLGFNVRVKF